MPRSKTPIVSLEEAKNPLRSLEAEPQGKSVDTRRAMVGGR